MFASGIELLRSSLMKVGTATTELPSIMIFAGLGRYTCPYINGTDSSAIDT